MCATPYCSKFVHEEKRRENKKLREEDAEGNRRNSQEEGEQPQQRRRDTEAVVEPQKARPKPQISLLTARGSVRGMTVAPLRQEAPQMRYTFRHECNLAHSKQCLLG